MKKRIAVILTLALLLSLISGCGQKSEASMDTYEMARAETYAANQDFATGLTAASTKQASAAIELPQNRKWVITMSLSTETGDMDTALEAISARIQQMQGYVESQNISGLSGRQRTASLTIRVPADQVDGFVEEVSGLTNLVSSSRNVRDITLTYTDTEGRVKALETEQTRLLELMEQAENMSDLLEIEARLTEVRYQLESYASTLRLYDNQVDYATVSLYITEVEKYTPVEEPGFFERITGGLAESIVNLGETIVECIVWLIVNLPYLIVLGLLGWGVAAIGKRIRRKRKAKKENRQ